MTGIGSHTLMRDFNEIAHVYDALLPDHVRGHLLERKVDLMLPYLKSGRGLDIGCGRGHYARRVVEKTGYRVAGVDISKEQINYARAHSKYGIEFVWGDGCYLPFISDSMDFAYAINVIHHVAPELRGKFFSEVTRVLKPGGIFVIHEMNPRNVLFRWYLNHVFPHMRHIDDGSEVWRTPYRNARYFGWMPDWTPAWAMPVLKQFESYMETTCWHPYSTHYMEVWEQSDWPMPSLRSVL